MTLNTISISMSEIWRHLVVRTQKASDLYFWTRVLTFDLQRLKDLTLGSFTGSWRCSFSSCKKHASIRTATLALRGALKPECWGGFRRGGVFFSRCCPEVQLSLKAQTGFDASFLVGWMGTVGREEEPSILPRTGPAVHPASLCIRMTQRFLVRRFSEWGEKWGMWLDSDSSRTLWIPETAAGKKKKKRCSFCGERGFSLLPNSTRAGNPVQRAAGIGKKPGKLTIAWRNNGGKKGNNSAVSALITSTAFVFVPFWWESGCVVQNRLIIIIYFSQIPPITGSWKLRADLLEPITGTREGKIFSCCCFFLLLRPPAAALRSAHISDATSWSLTFNPPPPRPSDPWLLNDSCLSSI